MSSAISALPPSASPTAVAARQRPHPPQAAELRARLDGEIVRASLEASIHSGDEPQALVLRSAIDRINELLAPTLGENAIQNARPADFTPEATAERIVSLSTGFFAAWQAQHPELEGDAALEAFMETIRGGFETGFREAEKILKGLGVLAGGVAEGIARTHELVQQGYDAFVEARRAA